jgi:nitrogen fixation/metabolism regulation signal transduction histidine kinase
MISLLASISGAFFLSRRLVSPIQDLVAGTKAVAKGNYDVEISVPSRDEIGFLVSSFNDMTKGLSLARKQASLSQAQVEKERTKLEIILASLSTGVISLEADLKLRIANKAAESILSIDLQKQYGKNLSDIAKGHSLLEQLFDIAKKRIDKGDVKWREQIVLRGEIGRRVLLCECTAIKSDKSDEGGFVIVFDDITALQQAQRDAAWGEVARRLAHEIKNPLTPIQLSAERMRRKYLKKMSPKDGAIMDRATHTIVQQVEAMKEMVNAFSDYARAPDMDIHLFGITSLINEVADLYRSKESDIKIIVETEASLPEIMADSGRVRQMLHNLIRNSIEILEFQDLGIITISATLVNNEGIDFILISVKDNGHGFASESIEKVFDPYVTSKPKGTGLGLAIVKKLVEEHIGRIEAENLAEGGASITILLPLNEVAREAAMALIPTKSENRRTQA